MVNKSINNSDKKVNEKVSQFKGLDVSELDFQRNRKKCSEVVNESCGTRDCTLEVYQLGDDLIVSGGLCPKGNTSSAMKRAPDYTRMYLNILDEHLKNITNPLDKPREEKIRIFVPRSMTFLNDRGVFYTAIYHHLGFDVRVSSESDDNITNMGKSYSHSEFCFPLILAHGHAVFLKSKMEKDDKLLLVNAIEVVSDSGEKYKFCPYVGSAGHVIVGNLDLKTKEVLLPVIRFNDKKITIQDSILKDLERVFGKKFSKEQVNIAIQKAYEDEKNFLDEVYSKGDEIIKGLTERGERIYIGIGRGYTIFDPKASSKVNELFSINGLHFLPTYFIRPRNKDIDKVVENMYWYQGRRMIQQTLIALEEKNMFPVRLTNFNCGPDSILHFHEEHLANFYNKPWLVLETDGHNSNAQFGTRILAHDRVVSQYLANPAKPEIKKTYGRNIDYENRIFGLPYMSDSSDILSGTLRAAGYKTEVMPSGTKESNELSKKIVSTNTCRPFSYQVGDQLAWLYSKQKQGIDPNKSLAIFIPTAKGPCRFGQYYVVLRELFDERGFEGVPIISPSSVKDYTDCDLPKNKINLVTRLSFKAVYANELLKNTLHRIRPYELNKGESDKVYDKVHNELVEFVATNPSLNKLKNFLIDKLKEFEQIKIDKSLRYPKVLVVGEIFMRAHEQSNQDSIKLLEEHKLEVILEPIFSWMNYVNKNALNKSIKRKEYGQFTLSFLKRGYINLVTSTLYTPFKEILKGREDHDPFHLIKDLEDNLIYDSAVEGEASLSIGSVNAFINGELDIDGIYHIGPLGCMQETIATSRSQALIHKAREKSGGIKIIPFMDAVFGESAVANLDSQIGIFAENCKLHKEIREKEIRVTN